MLLMTIFSYGHSVAQVVGDGPGGEIEAPNPCDDFPLPEMTIEVWSESFARAPHGTSSPYTIKPNNKFRVGLANYESGVTVVWQMPGAFIISEAQNPSNGGYDEVYYAEFPANTNDRYIRATVSRLGCTAVLEYEVPNPNNNPNHISNPFADWVMEDAGTNIVSYGNTDGAPFDASTVDIIEAYSPINTNVVSYVKSSIVYQGVGSATISGRVVFGNLLQQGPGVTNLITRNNSAPGGQLGTKAIEIRVKAGFQLTIENAILQAAHGDMWKGIVVEDGGVLYLKNVEIRDAFTAINSESSLSLGNRIYIQGSTSNPQGKLRIYNCMNGFVSDRFNATAQINDITVRSTRLGFNRPFDYNYNTSTYNTSTKQAWFLTNVGVQFNWEVMNPNINNITGNNWRIDGAMIGVIVRNNMMRFLDNAHISNCQKMAVYVNNSTNSGGDFTIKNSFVSVPSTIDATFQKEALDQSTSWPALLGTNTTDVFGVFANWNGTTGHRLWLTNNTFTTLASTTPKFAFSGNTFLLSNGNTFSNFSTALNLKDGNITPKAFANSNVFMDCQKGVAFGTATGTGGSLTEFKCNKFVVNATIPSGQTWYGLFNEYSGLLVNQVGPDLVSGANVFPIANESNRGNLPSGGANVNAPTGGWARKAQWSSFHNTPTSTLVYQRHTNEHVGNVGGNVSVEDDFTYAKTQSNQYNPNNVNAVLVCSNLADKIYFPLAAPRVTEIDGLEVNKNLRVMPNPFSHSFRVMAQRGDMIRCLTSTGKQVGLERKQVDEDQVELQLVDAPAGLYHLQIGTTYTKIIKQ